MTIKVKFAKARMSDGNFINFQDDFYNLLEKYGVKDVDGDHVHFDEICKKRDELADFIAGLHLDQ